MTKGIASGRFLACPKTYELCLPTFLVRIASFQDGYLTSDGFVGSRVPGPVESVHARKNFALPPERA